MLKKMGEMTASFYGGKPSAESRPKPIPTPKRKDPLIRDFDINKDFELKTTLGTGTFGRVRLVKSLRHGKYFALKILKKSEIIRLKQVEHIKSECKILAMVQHPFIVNMIGFFSDETKLYMCLEFINGGELFSHLRREGRFSNDASKFYTMEIVLAFEYLHSMFIVYRDLKPENLLIEQSGHLKITDFGFAKVVQDRTWTLCGTPEYLSPELVLSQGHNRCVDYWAYGVLVYELLYGETPFVDQDQSQIFKNIVNSSHILGGLLKKAKLRSTATNLIKRLLCKNPALRLGMVRGGIKDITNHDWFAGVDWAKLVKKKYKTPWKPKVKGEGDTSNFCSYEEEPIMKFRGNQKLFAQFNS